MLKSALPIEEEIRQILACKELKGRKSADETGISTNGYIRVRVVAAMMTNNNQNQKYVPYSRVVSNSNLVAGRPRNQQQLQQQRNMQNRARPFP